MFYMNDYDIAMAAQRFTDPETAKCKAVKILQAHKAVVDANSDGWAYWKPPVVAARRLMELIESVPATETQAHSELYKAITPLRSFYTRHPKLPRPEGI
jgi:hypothetical protein